MTADSGSLRAARDSFCLIQTGDMVLADAIIDPDFVNHEAGDDPEDEERNLRGPAGFLATGTWLRDAFSDLAFEEQEVLAEGDTVMMATAMTGRHTGTFQGIPGSGRTFRQNQVHIFRLRDGRIVSHRAVRDDLGLLFQLGWRPRPS